MFTPEPNAAVQQIADSSERIANMLERFVIKMEAVERIAGELSISIERNINRIADNPQEFGAKISEGFRRGMMGL